ncbi:LOW QUALITY PROTEIN: hypothetical protein PHMEG_0006242 [Phytophthora megakarya]|uniref:Uncharacterized protein n=1 Tax=Phytophthora megakarya TaxID=4795 RepID=A0A225WR48_9STRA|nr:LOW QUALITY PROTEIN: hypothetical protein PHMEG_0006242 [Phytophthora megakarya]
MELDLLPRSTLLLPGKSRGYWKFTLQQAKSIAKVNNENFTHLYDSGAGVIIVDSILPLLVGCAIDDSQKQECVGIGENVYMTEGRTRIKITLAGAYVYYFDAWVG